MIQGELRQNPLCKDGLEMMKAETDLKKWFELCYEYFHTCEWQKSRGINFDSKTGECLAVTWEVDGTPRSAVEVTKRFDKYNRFMNKEIHKQLLNALFIHTPSDRFQVPLVIKTAKGHVVLQHSAISVGSSCGHTDYADGFTIRLVNLI